jgi:hypothetical protein
LLENGFFMGLGDRARALIDTAVSGGGEGYGASLKKERGAQSGALFGNLRFRENPGPFLTLLGKVLPTQIVDQKDEELQVLLGALNGASLAPRVCTCP